MQLFNKKNNVEYASVVNDTAPYTYLPDVIFVLAKLQKRVEKYLPG